MFTRLRRPRRERDLEAVIGALSRSQTVIEFEPDGTIITVNENFLRTFGYAPQDIVGKHHGMLVDASYRASSDYREFWAALRRGESSSGIFKRLGKDGREIWIQATYNPVLDAAGRPLKVIKFAVDTTAEAESRQRLRAALDKIASNVMVADADGRIVYMNDAVTEMFRAHAAEIRKQLPAFEPEEVLGSSFEAFHRAPALQRSLVGALRETHCAEFRLGELAIKLILIPVLDDAGRRLGTVAQWIDRSAEVATEEEVRLALQAARDGDLTRRIATGGRGGFFASLAREINGILETHADLVRAAQRASAAVTRGASEISRGNMDLSHRTERAAASLGEAASAMQQVTASARLTADRAALARELSAAASATAENGGHAALEAVAAMQRIAAASAQISRIIGVIDDIALQTNLLALNAAVEAARAGEHGLGFAVVAAEVRSLALRGAEAAKEIKTLLGTTVGKVEHGAILVDAAGRILDEIVTAVRKVAEVVSEIADASARQCGGIEQASAAVVSMEHSTPENAALMAQAVAAAESLLEQAQQLSGMMARFRVDAGVAGA